MKKYRIKLNGRVYEMEMEEITGMEAAAVTKEEKPAEVKINAGAGETISAPMPGNILNVLVKAGDSVKKGQVIAILEAMKMENEIVSPVDGTVASVGVAKGQTVNHGDVIAQIS